VPKLSDGWWVVLRLGQASTQEIARLFQVEPELARLRNQGSPPQRSGQETAKNSDSHQNLVLWLGTGVRTAHRGLLGRAPSWLSQITSGCLTLRPSHVSLRHHHCSISALSGPAGSREHPDGNRQQLEALSQAFGDSPHRSRPALGSRQLRMAGVQHRSHATYLAGSDLVQAAIGSRVRRLASQGLLRMSLTIATLPP
jgi:hypothetical protein